MPLISVKKFSCSLEINGKYIGKIEIDNRISTFGEMTQIAKGKYQIVPVSEKYRSELFFLNKEEKDKIGADKATAIVDGTTYEGPVIIIDGKNITISETRIVPDLSEEDTVLSYVATLKRLNQSRQATSETESRSAGPQEGFCRK
ncbi:hypothetical protein TUM19329_01500 [Legionella antarctica]|uniref:Uncharacterized protein n=2 Tax=Legionella antarctica TaxID=2708020 RepID=A0A6F8T025_9GAMM|nr:hypothetical protein TUM19329_01500 [Legionella antarctica]